MQPILDFLLAALTICAAAFVISLPFLLFLLILMPELLFMPFLMVAIVFDWFTQKKPAEEKHDAPKV